MMSLPEDEVVAASKATQLAYPHPDDASPAVRGWGKAAAAAADTTNSSSE
jgi:hypothetical protein